MLMIRDLSWDSARSHSLAINLPLEISILPQPLVQPDLYSCPKAVLKPVLLLQASEVTDCEDTGLYQSL